MIRLICFVLISFSTLVYGGEKKDLDKGFKHFEVGITSYSKTISGVYCGTVFCYEADDGFSGLGFYVQGAVNDNFGVRFVSSTQNYEEDDSIQFRSLDYLVVLGSGLIKTGLKAYGLFGMYNDSLYLSNTKLESFYGLQVGGGIGYNWEPISVDFWLAYRQISDYADFYEDNFGTSVSSISSAGLSFGLRF